MPLTNIETLGDYLLQFEKEGNAFDCILSLSGGLHRESKGLFLLYQCTLITFILLYLASMVLYFMADPSIWFIYISFLSQTLILFPVILISMRRVKDPVTVKQKECVSAAIRVCQTYFSLAMTVTITYLGLSIYSMLTVGIAAWYVVFGIMGWVSLVAIVLLNVWGMFFIVLDAKVAQSEIRTLIEAVRQESLTMDRYDDAYVSIRHLKDQSASVADGLAVVAYISIVSCLMSIFLYRQIIANSSFSRFHVNMVVYMLGSVCLQVREAFIILLALPSIVEVNELQEQLVDTLARTEWGQATPSTIRLTTSAANYKTVQPNDVVVNYKNNVRLNLLGIAMTQPLCMYVLGRPVKRTEMKAQLTTVVLLAIGALGSFIVDSVVGSFE